MTQSPKRRMPDCYRLRVDGHLDDHWSAWFGDLTLTREGDGTTSLSGFVSDQAALHGLLLKVRDLGTTLISVEAIEPTEGPEGQHSTTRNHDRQLARLDSHAGGTPTGRRPPDRAGGAISTGKVIPET